jgi:hypothetical protein
MMAKYFPVIFGGIVAYILLLIYAVTVVSMTKGVIQHGMAEAPKDKDGNTLPKEKKEFTPGVVNIVTIIGGLVSALVVSKLAITKPGESPALTQLSEDASEVAKKLSTWLTGAYLVGWLATGLTALIVGVMVFPDSNATLGEIGTTWLGLAVASGYSYFGITPR